MKTLRVLLKFAWIPTKVNRSTIFFKWYSVTQKLSANGEWVEESRKLYFYPGVSNVRKFRKIAAF